MMLSLGKFRKRSPHGGGSQHTALEQKIYVQQNEPGSKPLFISAPAGAEGGRAGAPGSADSLCQK